MSTVNSSNTSYSAGLSQNNRQSNTASAGQTVASTLSNSQSRIITYYDSDWLSSSPSIGASSVRRAHVNLVLFKVEEIFYRAPEYCFASHARGFLRAPVYMEVNGRYQWVITLEGIKSSDFVSLLKRFYPQVHADRSLGPQDWNSILELATRFEAKRLRKEAINRLERLDLTWIDKVVLGRTCFVEDWFRDGCLEMISLPSGTISAQDMDRIGLKIVIRAFQAMERLIKLPIPSNLPPRRTDSERLANKISAHEFQDILPTLSQEPTNLVEEFWRSKVEGRADLLKEAASKVIKRLSSITWAEVEEHQHQLEDIERLLNGRLRYKDKRQYKLNNGRSKPLKPVDYQHAFEREFGPDLEDIRSRGQALEPRRPRFDDDPSSEERQTEVKNGLLDFAIAKYRIAIPFKFQVPAYIIAGVLFLLCIAWLAYYYLLPLDRSNFPSVSPIVASALDL